MKNFSILYIAAVVLLVASGIVFLTREDSPETLKDHYITGVIYEIKENRILVVEGVTDEGYGGDIGNIIGNAGWFTIKEETQITENRKNLTVNDLNTGYKVDVTVTGPVMESYPVQGTASKIEILEKELLVECFVGGCSGELCSSDPNAISTCEFLPGMECLRKEASCESSKGECTWVLSQKSAECFLAIKEEQGEKVTETRIGYLFEKAEMF